MPLTDEQVTAGSRVKSPGGDEYDVRDVVVGGSGNRWLILSEPDSPEEVVFQDAGLVRSEWEEVDPAEVAEDRQARAQSESSEGAPRGQDTRAKRPDESSSRQEWE